MFDALRFHFLRQQGKVASLASSFEKVIWYLRSGLREKIPPITHQHDGYFTNISQRTYIFVSAGAYSSPFQFRNLLYLLDALECEDPRDKIYGTRTLVDWPGGSIPLPNYSKDSFVLAKEMVDILHVERPSQSSTWYATSLIHMVSLLAQSLITSQDHAVLREGIQSRREPPELRADFACRHGQQRVGDIRWTGVQIIGHFTVKRYERYSKLQWSHEGSHRLPLFVPKQTCSDDWIVISLEPYRDVHTELDDGERRRVRNEEEEFVYRNRGFVLRASRDGSHYQILGPAYRSISCPLWKIPSTHWKWFIFWWDSEDLLIHDLGFREYDSPINMDEQAEVVFAGQFSRFEGASYAKGPFSAEEIKEKLDNDPDTSLLEPERPVS